jgi:prepilin-type processing-associated H-X9-DG protein
MRCRGVTLLDLLIGFAVVVFIAGLTTLLADQANDTANRIRCASNMRMIGQALLLYANENRGTYPRTTYDPATAEKPTAFTNPHPGEPDDDEKQAHLAAPYIKAGPKPNDVTAAMFALITTQEITPEVFICPSVEAATTQPIDPPDRFAMDNFERPNQLSYSFCNPYPSESAADAGYKLDNTLNAEFAVLADLNPGVDELLTITTTADAEHMRKVNSTNHDGDGQNVLYGDGHVEFQQNPFVGLMRDNIYTYGKSGDTSGGDGIIGSPTTKDDSILLPTSKQAALTTQPAGK